MKSKKAQEGVPWILILFIIAIIAGVILIFIFKKGVTDTNILDFATCKGRGGTCLNTGDCSSSDQDKICGLRCGDPNDVVNKDKVMCCCIPPKK